ncbi:MAG: NAD(P)H-hydrate dehydratase [Clostridia bacterium]|mgnify:CR=1 FL=1|jgi:ADP-dependent NAD(P)H-hydrate dehydratase / NAD(P)H-hydrate epimerase|nr:NAD(P)H-hydrate dehydratase [Clostridia bacterium]MBT7122106.1 NAD(P)H-hydrate dehydratase [Clostridia bacterium]
MIKVVSKMAMQSLDNHMIEKMMIPSLLLMENAAFGITSAVCDKFDANIKISVICGVGNNGGDGFACARQLKAKGYNVRVYLVGKTQELKGDAKTNADTVNEYIVEISDANQVNFNDSDIIIDAIFGIGLSREVIGLHADVIENINNSGAYVIACDIASGIEADSGKVLGTAVMADETITFACAKSGHFIFPGRKHTGELSVKEIGILGEFDLGEMSAYSEGLTLNRRETNAHKGNFGKLACVVASEGMSGAGIMCAQGALRSGAGITTIGVPSSLQGIFSASVPECMTYALDDKDGALSENCLPGIDELMSGKSALASGCGLSQSIGAKKAVEHMIVNYDIRKVFDADALNIISCNTNVLLSKAGDIVLTPHIVEFARLCGETIVNPLQQAQQFAKKYNVTLLLKGATTIVTDGMKTAFVLTGSPGMAKGGSGDVLTGVIGGQMACGRDCFTAALYGAYICGKAGEKAAFELGEHSMTALDTLFYVSDVMKEMTE